MNYLNLVKKYSRALKKAGLLKVATDLSELLDSPVMAYPKAKPDSSYEIQNRAELREGPYHDLCSVLSEASVPRPPLEPEFYESLLTEKVQGSDVIEASRIIDHLDGQAKDLQDDAGTQMSNVIREVLRMFPQVCGWASINKKLLVAQLNKALVSAGREPLRPEYNKFKVGAARQMLAPKKKARVLIVDDDPQEIMKTLRALAGWPNVTIMFLAYDRRVRVQKTENKIDRIQQLATDIGDYKADVILMDQGLDSEFKGSEVVSHMMTVSPNATVFVGNTGGDDKELREAGALENCNKGNNLRVITKALEKLEKVDRVLVAT